MKYFQNIRGGVKPAPASKSDFSGCSAVCYFSKNIALQTFLALCIVTSPALAEDSKQPPATSDKEAVAQIGDADTHLAVDTEHNIIRIMIEGKEVGRFDKDGLHVVGNVEYTGTLTDTAATWLDQIPSEKGEKNAK